MKVETATEVDDDNKDRSLDYSFMYQPKTSEDELDQSEEKNGGCVDDNAITIHIDKKAVENDQTNENVTRTNNFVENWIRTSPTTCDPVEVDIGVDNPSITPDENTQNIDDISKSKIAHNGNEVSENKNSATIDNNSTSPQRFYFDNSIFSCFDDDKVAPAVSEVTDNIPEQAKSSPATSRDSSTNLEHDNSSCSSIEENFADRKSSKVFDNLPTRDGDIVVPVSDRRHSLPPNDSAYGSNTPSDCYETHSLQYRSSIDSRQGRPGEFTASSKMEDLTQIHLKKHNHMDNISYGSKSSKSESLANENKFLSIKQTYPGRDSGRDEESDNDESDNDESDASSSEEETVEYFNGPGRSQSVTNLGARQPALDEDTRQRSISSDNIIDTSSPSLKRSKGLFSVVDGVKGESGVVGDDLDASGITDEEDNSFVNEIMDTLRMDADWNSMFGQWKLTTRSRSFHAPRSNPNNNRSKRSASTVDIPKKIETI